ncbi:hypothetical protein AOY78_04965 [Escherichia coli]|nr:hypothetical protein AOY78_04965 [Escherichia coli]
MKYKRRSTGEEKVQKIAAGEEGNYRMERVPLKQTDRHHKSPGGDLCIRDSTGRGRKPAPILTPCSIGPLAPLGRGLG